MKTILLVAHGSRKQSSNEEVAELAKRMNQNLDSHFDNVKYFIFGFNYCAF